MFRIAKLLTLFLALSFALSPEMKLRRLKENIYMVRGIDGLPSLENRGFMSNAFAVLTRDGWVVIDALSTPSLSKEFVENLRRVKRAPIKYAIITHYHPDHWYGAKTYKQLGAKIVTHHQLLEEYNSGQTGLSLDGAKQRFKGLFDDVELIPPDIVVKDVMELRVGNEIFKLVALEPTHTNNDLIVYMPKSKVLFVGDLVGKNRVMFVGDRNASVGGWLRALELIKGFDAEMILAGHNEPLRKDDIEDTRRYLSYLREHIKRMKEEGRSLDEIRSSLQSNAFVRYAMYKEFHNANIFAVYNQLDYEE